MNLSGDNTMKTIAERKAMLLLLIEEHGEDAILAKSGVNKRTFTKYVKAKNPEKMLPYAKLCRIKLELDNERAK